MNPLLQIDQQLHRGIGDDGAMTDAGFLEGGYPSWHHEKHEPFLVLTTGLAEIDCEECDFDFTRVSAALSCDGAGRFTDGVEGPSGWWGGPIYVIRRMPQRFSTVIPWTVHC